MFMYCLQVLAIGFGIVLSMLTLLYFIIQIMSVIIRFFERIGQRHIRKA